jgi:hypothetical protein
LARVNTYIFEKPMLSLSMTRAGEQIEIPPRITIDVSSLFRQSL